MNESLLKDETLTTADIARPGTPVRELNDVERSRDMADERTRDWTDQRGRDLNGIERSRAMADDLDGRMDGRQGVPEGVAAAGAASDAAPLFPEDELNSFRARWSDVQTSFVDEPRHAVEQADSLVANVVKRIAEQFAAERATLEEQWGKGDNVSTEDLRQSLKRYRSLFDRLLSF